MKSNFWQRHPRIADTFGIFIFFFCVTLGTILINNFIFQSFTIVGSSMEPTFKDGDKVIINRLPLTWANLTNTKFTPKRGEIIVFESNNSYDSRSGLGTVPLYKIVGPVAFRILPFNKIRNFEYSQDY